MYSRDPVDLLTDELNHVRQCLGQEQSANRVLATSKPMSCERQLTAKSSHSPLLLIRYGALYRGGN